MSCGLIVNCDFDVETEMVLLQLVNGVDEYVSVLQELACVEC